MSEIDLNVGARPRRTHRALWSAVAVGVIAAALIGVLATRSVAPQTTASTALLGHVAPSVSGKTIVGDKEVSLASLRGRYVVLAFFASWCAPCTQEAPQLESFLFSHHATDNVAVLGIDIDDSAPDAAAFLQRTGATWPALEDSSGLISQDYGVEEPPQSYLINPEGVVFARVLSGVTESALNRLIAQEQRVATTSGSAS